MARRRNDTGGDTGFSSRDNSRSGFTSRTRDNSFPPSREDSGFPSQQQQQPHQPKYSIRLIPQSTTMPPGGVQPMHSMGGAMGGAPMQGYGQYPPFQQYQNYGHQQYGNGGIMSIGGAGSHGGPTPVYQSTGQGYQGTPLKVSANSKPKSVAGKIAHITRSGEAPTIMAIGPSSINQTVKAIAIARTYLKDNDTDLMVFPKFHRLLAPSSGDPNDTNRNNMGGSIAFELQKSTLRRRELESTSEMKVAQTSEPGPVAGAIAGQIRSGERVSLTSIGPGSVSQAVKAIAIARRYLADGQQGNDEKEPTPGGIDVSFRPEFIHIPYDDDGEQQQRSAIKFKLFAQQIA